MAVLILVAFILASSLLFFQRRNVSATGARLPPGPKGKFLFGNALDIPPQASWIWYEALKKTYGDVAHITVMGTPLIILNSFKSINEMFLKRGSNCSDRPRMVMAGEVVGIEHSTVLLRYGSDWQIARKLWHQYMGKTAMKDYDEVIRVEAQILASSLIHDSNTITAQLRLLVVKVLMRTGFGIRVNSLEDPFIAATDAANRDVVTALTPGRYLVDVLPLLKYLPTWLPGTEWKRFGLRARARVDQYVRGPYQNVKDAVASGNFEKSFVSEMLKSDMGDDFKKMWISGSIYGAGVDTTHTALNQFVAAIVLYPEIQQRAQAEIDAVIGRKRLPTIEDQEDLPYIDAVIQEVLRWNSILPIGVPHVTSTDDEYEGYLIPKGALCIGNLWALSQDADMYPDPTEFKPERFLPNPGDNKPVDPRTFAFGVGRRVCVGRYFAERVLYNVVVTLLATCSISKPIDSKGEEVNPKITFFKGSIIQEVEPFQARVRARFPEALALLRQAI